MAHSRRNNLYPDIITLLQEQPLNTFQIAKRLNRRWETINSALELLELLELVKQENKTFHLISPSGDPDTYLHLPLTEDQKTTLVAIANRCHQLSPVPLDQETVQRIVVAVIRTEQLALPYGWFLSGESTPLSLPFSSQSSIIKTYDKTIQQCLEKNHDRFSYLSSSPYQSYSSYMKIETLFKQPFTENNLTLLDAEFRTLFRDIPKEQSDVLLILETFYSSFSWMRHHPLDILESYRMDLYTAFQSCWTILASYFFIQTISEYYSFDLEPYFKNSLVSLQESFTLHMTQLQYRWPRFKKLSSRLERFRVSLEEQSQ